MGWFSKLSNNYGFRYVQGNTNGPSWGGSQNYGFFAGLGNDYNGNYGSQFYWARDTVNPYISIRFREGDGWKAWTKISAGYADSAPWSGITSKPTTIAGYGITDAILVNSSSLQIDFGGI